MNPVRRLLVRTHRDPAVVGDGVATLVRAAQAKGIELVAGPDEGRKHELLEPFVTETDGIPEDIDAAVVLAGDGTLLHVAGELVDGPPVLGINYGMVGYLAGASHERVEEAVHRLATGEYATVELDAIEARLPDGRVIPALNDIVASGGVTGRVIEVSWRIVTPGPDGAERVDPMGSVPCDGMVVATPIGSTAYNLSNGGPVVAWGVGGYVVSFIAPHTLAARPLVVAPRDSVELQHLGRGANLQILVDGRHVGDLEPGESLSVGPGRGRARLALIETQSFYARYRDHFAATQVLHGAGPRPRAAERRAAGSATAQLSDAGGSA